MEMSVENKCNHMLTAEDVLHHEECFDDLHAKANEQHSNSVLHDVIHNEWSCIVILPSCSRNSNFILLIFITHNYMQEICILNRHLKQSLLE